MKRALVLALLAAGLVFFAIKSSTTRADDAASAGPGKLMVEDDFANLQSDIVGEKSGFGWAAAWDRHDEGNHNSVEGNPPLTYLNLKSSGHFDSNHGEEAGRFLDVKGALATFAVNDEVGKPGTTLWLSCLIRRDDAQGNYAIIGGHKGGVVYRGNDDKWNIGFDGRGQPNKAVPYVLQIDKKSIPTTVMAEAGKAALLVLKFEFKDGSTDLSLYVNPTTLGGAAPDKADATGTENSALIFKCINYAANRKSALGEIRLGDSFAAVTPTSGAATQPAR